MTIREMHYDYKQKLNKIDSQQYRNLRVPEIDWKINEAIDLFIKAVAEPKFRTMLGFEKSQRNIDDIRPLVVNAQALVLADNGDTTFTATLPNNYQHFVSVNKLTMKDGDCSVDAEKIYVRQHDDDFQQSSFDKSSFKWREANIRFYSGGIKIFTSGEFDVEHFSIDYIRKHVFVHNAQDFTAGSYNSLNGVVLSGSQNCELPDHTHREIVDLAVAITTGDLQIPDYQIKQAKLRMNQLN